MGDFYELWTGLFQSTILGRIPYVNVDVAHKAFPAPVHLLDVAHGLLRGGDFNAPLHPNIAMQLKKHLQGLRIIYDMTGQDASTKGYKFMALGETPDKEIFESNDRRISVLQYFQSKNCPLRFSKLQCIKVGNAVRNITLPMEFCRIPGGQVNIVILRIETLYNTLTHLNHIRLS